MSKHSSPLAQPAGVGSSPPAFDVLAQLDTKLDALLAYLKHLEARERALAESEASWQERYLSLEAQHKRLCQRIEQLAETVQQSR